MYVVFEDEKAEFERHRQKEQRQRKLFCAIFVVAFIIVYGAITFLHSIP